MAKRGRKSATDLTLPGRGITKVERPLAPMALTDEQAVVWDRIVNAMPADWFKAEHYGQLTAYCRHEINHGRVAQLIQEFEKSPDFTVDEYDKLLKMQARESAAIASLAVKLRISPSTEYRADKKRGGPKGNTTKPWDKK